MQHCVPFIANQAVGKVSIDAKTIARSKFASQVQVGTIYIIMQFRKTTELNKTPWSAHRRDGLAGKKRSRTEKAHKKQRILKKNRHFN
jgi:hypothetical protein